MKKSIVLCADDFGQAPAINNAILQLCQLKRLSAVSCLVTMDHWQRDAKKIGAFANQVDIGLHFNLTEGEALTSAWCNRPLKNLLLAAYARALPAQLIEAELNAQIDVFVASEQNLPNFIDGHEHIHQLPVIREILLKVYKARFSGRKTYIRSAFFSHPRSFKQLAINVLGGAKFSQLLKKNSIPHNCSFAGAYNLSPRSDYARLFCQFLQRVNHRGLIMCHPGAESSNDRIAGVRSNELAYFMSENFLQDCLKYNVSISRFEEAFIV